MTNQNSKRTVAEVKAWKAVVKRIRAKYPEMSDKAVYTRARYALAGK